MNGDTFDTVIYEFPLHERMRTLLRLEHLFQQMRHHLDDASPWGSRAAVNGMIDILNVFGRTDLKLEIIKELDRLGTLLERMGSSPGINDDLLRALLSDLQRLVDGLYESAGQVGIHLRKNEFLSAVRQRSTIPGGTCNFDLPGLHHWLTRGSDVRLRDLREWYAAFAQVDEAVALILRVQRQSATAVAASAVDGFYQQATDASGTCHMIRILVDRDLDCFPEVSGGKHRFTLRFLSADTEDRPPPVTTTVPFRIARCVL